MLIWRLPLKPRVKPTLMHTALGGWPLFRSVRIILLLRPVADQTCIVVIAIVCVALLRDVSGLMTEHGAFS